MAKQGCVWLVLILAVTLSACGGGTGGGSVAPATTPVAQAPTADIAATVAAQVQATVIAQQVAATVAAQQATAAGAGAAPTSLPATGASTATTNAVPTTSNASTSTAIALNATAAATTAGATNAAGGQRVELFDGKVSFVLPPDFRELDEAEKQLKYPRGNAPAYAYANDRLSVSIAVSRPSAALTPEQLGEFRQAMEQTIERSVPDINWLARDSVTINGRAWEHLQFTSAAIDTDIHNDVYMTAFDGAPLLFNFNTTVGQYEAARAGLEQSRDSITISE